MNRVDRLLGYLLLFQSRGLMRAQDFAETFEISERTVYRDIQALSEVGVPIAAMPGEGYRLLEGYYLPPIMFSQDEARALFLALSMLQAFTSVGNTHQAAGAALEKIRAVLPKATRAQVEALQAVLGFYTVSRSPLNLDDPLFIDLQQAIYQRRVVHLHYHALHNNETTMRDVEPLELAYVDNAWILTAYCRLRQAQRNFRLDRIDHLVLRAEQFTPRSIAARGYAGGPWRVVVRFDTAVVRWVEERQHWTYRETVSVDAAGAVMAYQVQSLSQIMGWLLSWADHMEVLTPLELRERIAETAVSLQQRHQ